MQLKGSMAHFSGSMEQFKGSMAHFRGTLSIFGVIRGEFWKILLKYFVINIFAISYEKTFNTFCLSFLACV